MSYLGNQPATGENNSFKILDDITSYTLTFDGSDSSIISLANDTITLNNHRFVTGQRVTYSTTGTAIGNLISGSVYYIIKYDQNSIQLALSYVNALSGTYIQITGPGVGTNHTFNVAFDGINTKFKATYDNGTKAQMTRAAQLQISINGVIQQPQDTTSPTNGFGIDVDSTIVFSVAPAVSDVFWGNLVANNFPTFDIADNTVDSFTGNGVLTDFTLSKTPANNQNILVTIDGVVQYPSDATTVRAYTLYDNVLSFVGAPGNGTAIQVRHIGFAGATSSAVTGFYGRVGNVSLNSADNINVASINITGAAVSMGNVGAGIVTASKFVGDGSLLTGVVSSKWRNNTAGITTQSSVGVNTTSVDVSGLTGVGNSFNGLYVSNGMVIMDNTLNGNHYIGTNFNGLMAGPVNIAGVLTIDGNYVVV
jgi:hypothetical protein